MPKIRKLTQDFDLVIREEYVGYAFRRICYPGISSCITITGNLGGYGLVGTHITIATEIQLIDDALEEMSKKAGACRDFYVIGAISIFKAKTDKSINTRKKISEKIKSAINQNATVKFYDTSNKDVHIFVESYGVSNDFFRVKSQGNLVAGSVYPDFANRKLIDSSQFVIR